MINQLPASPAQAHFHISDLEPHPYNRGTYMLPIAGGGYLSVGPLDGKVYSHPFPQDEQEFVLFPVAPGITLVVADRRYKGGSMYPVAYAFGT